MTESRNKTMQHGEISGRAKNVDCESKQCIQFVVIRSIVRTGRCWSDPA